MDEQTVKEQRADELEAIRAEAGGVISPQAVVDYARDGDTALHSAFTWNNTKAAEQYRLWQARQVIRVCVTCHEKLRDPIRVYVSMQEDRGEEGYRLLDDVMSDKDMRESLLIQAMADLKRWKAKYRQLTVLAPIFEAMDGVQRRRAKTK